MWLASALLLLGPLQLAGALRLLLGAPCSWRAGALSQLGALQLAGGRCWVSALRLLGTLPGAPLLGLCS